MRGQNTAALPAFESEVRPRRVPRGAQGSRRTQLHPRCTSAPRRMARNIRTVYDLDLHQRLQPSQERFEWHSDRAHDLSTAQTRHEVAARGRFCLIVQPFARRYGPSRLTLSIQNQMGTTGRVPERSAWHHAVGACGAYKVRR